MERDGMDNAAGAGASRPGCAPTITALAPCNFVCADSLDWAREQPDGAFDLTFGSPPYEDARTYGIGFRLKGQAWVDWMAERVVEFARITSGLVVVNAAGRVKQFKYSPVVEWLVADLTRVHGLVCGPAPYVFHRVGIPGSGGPHYHRRDWEPLYAFARAENLPPKWSDNTAMGHPPKWAPGGKLTYRGIDGKRRHLTGGTSGHRRDGSTIYHAPGTLDRAVTEIANPGNVIRCNVGGGKMGSDLAHENEAPFPEGLAEFFILSFVPPGGTVLDPWSGSGTTVCVARRCGRGGVGVDIRQSQVDLGCRRLATVQPEAFA